MLSLLYSAVSEYFVCTRRNITTRFFNNAEGAFTSFVPTSWAPYPIQQMLLSRVLWIPRVEWTKVLTLFDDGVVCRLDICPEPAVTNNIILLCHGFGGSVESPYCSHVAHLAKANGYTTIVYNRRAHVPESHSPTYPVHYDQDDLENVIDWIKNAYPDANLYGVGCSMGGNLLARYAGIKGSSCPFKKIVSVSNGFDLHAGVEVSKVVPLNNKLFMSFTREILCNVQDGNTICTKIKSFSDLEGKALGLSDMSTYYSASSSITELANVAVPCLCIYSDDDILLNHKDEFYSEMVKTNPKITVIATSHGGHVGFVSPDFKCDWWIKNALTFLKAI